jgi:hypothetical protein
MEVAMIRITFTEEQVAQLRCERFHHPHPRVQAKMEPLLLKSGGLPGKEICRAALVAIPTALWLVRSALPYDV